MKKSLNLFWGFLVVLFILVGLLVIFIISDSNDKLAGEFDDGGQPSLEGEVGALDSVGEGERVITSDESSEVDDLAFCNDSDGLNPNLQSWSYSDTFTFQDSCFNDTVVSEGYCNGTIGVFVQLMPCESGCLAGACLPVPQPRRIVPASAIDRKQYRFASAIPIRG